MYDVALLDFDGYICKAYYATISKGSTDFDEMLALLEELVGLNNVKESIKKIKELQSLCTHKNIDNNFARNEKGYCIYCGAMIDDCN